MYRFLRPLIFSLPPERAHNLTLKALSIAQHILPDAGRDDHRLAVEAMGLHFSNPFGMAAGFDKNAQVYRAMFKLGFGFCEIGTLTPLPQMGNPKPRIFRLSRPQAIINRMGFNNEGQARAYHRLFARHEMRQNARGILGVNIGANKDSASRIDDYVHGAAKFHDLADYLTINVSSPNTPGLRDLQAIDNLQTIIRKVRRVATKTAILVKLSPDLSPEDVDALGLLAMEEKLDGLIISNTTLSRPHIDYGRYANEAGGLSGRPLMAASTEMLRQFYRLTDGKITLIGVGGISNATEAYEKIRAGAHLVQLYSALTFQGPALIKQLKAGVLAHMEQDGFNHIRQIVGIDA